MTEAPSKVLIKQGKYGEVFEAISLYISNRAALISLSGSDLTNNLPFFANNLQTSTANSKPASDHFGRIN